VVFPAWLVHYDNVSCPPSAGPLENIPLNSVPETLAAMGNIIGIDVF
jgi:hypothetical protein